MYSLAVSRSRGIMKEQLRRTKNGTGSVSRLIATTYTPYGTHLWCPRISPPLLHSTQVFFLSVAQPSRRMCVTHCLLRCWCMCVTRIVVVVMNDGLSCPRTSHLSSHSRLHAFMLRNIGFVQSIAFSSVLFSFLCVHHSGWCAVLSSLVYPGHYYTKGE